ncbi:MAG TPA: YCF48-related protein, partial [Puia sp.]|nr:YCF48-related protein [Puia sp.]
LLVRSGNGGQSYASVTPTNGFKDGWDIYSIAFVAPDTGFAVGLLGRILKTMDGGQTWNTYSPTYIPVTAVSFPSPSTGYATTWNNVYKTTDSGQTWNLLGLTTGTAYGSSSRFERAHFLNADTGFVTASSSVEVYRTTDGGQTWAGANPAPYSYDNTIGMSFPSPDTGYISLEESGACCSGMIEKTTNGGQTWSTVWGSQYDNQYFSDITYVDPMTVYGIQYYQLFKSIDGGATWKVVYTADYYQLTGVVFTDINNGYLTDANGYIHISRDGGQTWQQVNYPGTMILPAPITSLAFFNGAIGYMGGGNQFGPGNYGYIFKTIDSGRTWHAVNDLSATSIQFTSDSNVIVAGFGGEIVKSRIGGWLVDSLQEVYDGSCGARLSASVGVAPGRVDSISFIITGPNGAVIQIPASPASVINGNTDVMSPDSSFLSPGVQYTAQVRFLYHGDFRYSNAVTITGPGVAAPVIKDSLGWLVSNYNNNIWYLNGVVIPGTNAPVWQPNSPGVYSAQARNYPCVSAMSDSVTLNSSWFADSLIAQSTDSCAELFSTTIHVALASVYNVSIEVSDSLGYLQEIDLSPATVTNSTASYSAKLNSYVPGITYTAKVRLVFNGSFQYGQPTSWVGVNIQQPTITRDAAGVLHSSATTGNQWYLNNTAIPGAALNQYNPAAAGVYTVQVTVGSCVSAMSDTVDVAAASTTGTGTSANLGVVIYPNPVKDQLTVMNTQDRSLVLTIVNMTGVQVYTVALTANQGVLSVGGLPPGQYILHVQDGNTGETANVRFVKV